MKLCLAGNMHKNDFLVIKEAKKKQSINILQSFFDFQNSDSYFYELYNLSDFFILDSGAFSMLYGNKKVNLETYISSYIDFVKKKNIKNYIELDLYKIIGIPETEQLRKKLEIEIGRPSIPVFHKELGFEYFNSLVSNYKYIAMGGIAMGGRNGYTLSILNQLLKIAKNNNCKVHGLGYTSVNNLRYLDWYSVDSTSWLASSRFGAPLNIFNGVSMVRVPKPKDTKMVTKTVRENQLNNWLKYMNYLEKNR